MGALASDLETSEYINLQTSFVVVSILAHIHGGVDFIRTVLVFQQSGVGALVTQIPQNFLIIPNIFAQPLDRAVNVLLIIVFFVVAILGIVLLTFSILSIIRRYKQRREKELKMTMDIWWTICQRSCLLAFAISFIISFLAITFRLVKPIEEVLQNPISPLIDELIVFFYSKQLMLVFGIIIVIIFLFAFLVFSIQLALYYNMFNDVLITFALYQIPVLVLFLALSYIFLQVFGDRIQSFANMPFLVTSLFCIFDKNLFVTINFHNPGTLHEALPALFATVFFMVMCIDTFPFAYIHLSLTRNLYILDEIYKHKKVLPLLTRLQFWMCRVCRRSKKHHQKDSLEMSQQANVATGGTNQDSETQAPNSARPFLQRSGSIVET